MSYKSKLFQPSYDGFDLIIDFNQHYYHYLNLQKDRLYNILKNNLISIIPEIQFIISSFINSYFNIVFLNKKDENTINNFINQYETLLSYPLLYPSFPGNNNHKFRELIVNTYYFVYENYIKNL